MAVPLQTTQRSFIDVSRAKIRKSITFWIFFEHFKNLAATITDVNEEVENFMKDYDLNHDNSKVTYDELDNAITEEEVNSAINNLKCNKACGLDGLCN